MTATTAFPVIDLTGVTERPLVEILKKDPETPEFNAILRRKRRVVSQLRNTRWPGATAGPDVRGDDEPPRHDPEPEAEPAATQAADEEPERASEEPGEE